MMRLLRVELRRLWARRVTRWASAVVLLLVALGAFTAYQTAKPPSAQQIAEAKQFYADELEWWESEGEQAVAECAEGAEAEGMTPAEWGCENMEPRLENYLPPTQTFVPSAEQLEESSGAAEAAPEGEEPAPNAAAVQEIQQSVWHDWGGLGTLDELAALLLMVALVVGVSFVTAEVNSGSMGMWLTFEPRRRRVYWSKAAAAALGTVPLVAVGFGLLVGTSYAAYASFDALGTMTGDVWVQVAGFAGRLVAAGALAAVIGVALGILLKHAAAAVGLVAAGVWASAVFAYPLGELQRWLPTTNVTAWLNGGNVFVVDDCAPDADGMFVCTQAEHVVTAGQGGLYLLVAGVVIALLSVVVFRRRDVS
ncbi:hypothetical protein GCM10009809_40850 [Isoptericola hypogeus]|uniref:ABC-2 type transport system permease protein n=1 Tax=Isoptericola hypogeus TaxID=300179 RepID=A0ABP4VXN1_9MICO